MLRSNFSNFLAAITKLNNEIASWDTKFETGTKAALLHPFSPIVVAADENERIRYVKLDLFFVYKQVSEDCISMNMINNFAGLLTCLDMTY